MTTGDDTLAVGFPSVEFPGPTPFRLRMPRAWRGVSVPDADLAVGAPDAVARFRPNVVVNVHRIARTDRPELDLALLLAADDGLPGVEVLEDEARPGPMFARRRVFRHRGPENVVLHATRLLVVAPVGEHLADVVSAVGSVAAAAPAEVRAEVAAVVDSLRVAGG